MKFKIIYSDCPWYYNDQGCQGTMANHFKGMKIVELKKLPISEIADDNSILFFWVTYPMLQEALEVIEAWNFRYRTIAFQWIKMNKKKNTPFYGLGRWTRGNSEVCLLATRGKPKRINKSIFQLVFSPRRKHSQKPDEVRDRIVQLMGNLSRIELFATEETEGWTSLGNEIDGRDIRESLKNMIEK